MSLIHNRKAIISIGGILLAAFVILAAHSLVDLSQYPDRRAARVREQLAQMTDQSPETRIPLETALLQYETDNRIKIWTAIVQGAGGAALLLGLLFTARNLQATQDKLDVDRQGQLTNRFIQATSQLGAELSAGRPNVEVRLGGIYALNRIAKDWPKDYWPIAEVLTAYVRHNAARHPAKHAADKMQGRRANPFRRNDLQRQRYRTAPPNKPRTDIQAILTVLGRDEPPNAFNERHKLDFRNTDLRGAEFWDARMDWADFWGAHLEGAKFWGACLRHAKLENANLVGANLRAANLEHATLHGANVTGAIFDGATVWPKGFDALANGAVFTA